MARIATVVIMAVCDPLEMQGSQRQLNFHLDARTGTANHNFSINFSYWKICHNQSVKQHHLLFSNSQCLASQIFSLGVLNFHGT